MAASVSESVPASDSKSMEIKMELISLNDELVKLEYTYSVYVVNPEEDEEEEEKRRVKGKGKQKVGEIEEIAEQPQSQQREKLISDLEEWNLKAQPYIKDHVTPFLTSNIFQSYKTLKLLHKFLNYNLLSRSQSLTTMILKHQEQEDDDEGDEHDIAKTVLKKTVFAAKGMVSEIRDVLAESSSKKITLAEYMKDESNSVNLPFEYGCLGNIRIRAVLAAIQLSKRLSQFMFSLSDRDEELLEKVVSEIKKLTQKAENSSIASKFVAVMDATLSAISEQKQKQKGKSKKKEVTAEAMAMEERMIKDLCRCICDLEFVLCSENVPEAVKMVNGARVRMEVVLGLMLYTMQGIRLLVGKNNHGDDHVMWYKLKTFIADLWKIQQYDEFASSIY